MASTALQIRSDRAGEIADDLRADPQRLGAAFDDSRLEPVLEMLVRHDGEPGTFPRALGANLRRSTRSACGACTSTRSAPREAAPLLCRRVRRGARVAEDAGLIFGVEHNAPGHRLLVAARRVEALLDALPGLGFVWDVNHTLPEHLDGVPRAARSLDLVHVSDTPLPETNHHLPLGRGSVDFSVVRGLDVPLILEIGGLPISGGPGLDTDEALLDSRDGRVAATRSTGVRGGCGRVRDA